MKRILVSETGGTLTRNFVNSLKASGSKYYIIGVTSHEHEIALSNADESYLVPKTTDARFIPILSHIAQKTKADFLHSQHDSVISVLSANRHKLPVAVFLPKAETVKACVDKYKSYQMWSRAMVPVPKTVEIVSPRDITRAFSSLGKTIWIRLKQGGGGAGALPVSDPLFARNWINHFDGWGKFTASEMLSSDSVTWSSIWKEGALVVAQSRKRMNWLFANRTLSGVTGVTGTAVTIRDKAVDVLAQQAIRAIDPSPHGIFSVDMTYDKKGNPRVTEINIGRFFTTIHFFTKAGLNMPDIFVRMGLGRTIPHIARVINPLPPGLVWVRGMDTEPVLTTQKALDRNIDQLHRLNKK
jgi:hypothetical protein